MFNFESFVEKTEIRQWGPVAKDSLTRQRLKTYPRLPKVKLPKLPPIDAPLGFALLHRQSAEDFCSERLSLSDLAQLLASVGFRSEPLDPVKGRRTYPSAGARYPGEVYLVALDCENVAPGLYHYSPREHELEDLMSADLREACKKITNDLRLERASALLALSLVMGRTSEKYGIRGIRYGLIEIGHMAQNLCLAACSLGVRCLEIGGFIDSEVNRLLDVDIESEAAVLLVALGGRNIG